MFSFRINPLFFLLALLFFLVNRGNEFLIAFSAVFLHELAHMIIAYKSGYKIKKVELFPFGGMAEYRGLLEMEPWHEIIIALSGPVLSLSLAGLFFVLKQDIFLKYNLIIGLFNLIPALPLDGGRVFRGLLVSKIGFKNGSRIAVKVSKNLAICGFILGIFSLIFNNTNIWVLFISFFVYAAAVKENKQYIYNLLTYLTQRKKYIKNIRRKQVMFQVVEGNMHLNEVISFLVPDKFNIFYVLNNESKIEGLISEEQLLEHFFNIKKEDIKIIKILK